MNNEIMPKTESDVKRMASIAMAVALSAFTSVFAGYSVKDGYYVFDNAESETCSEVLSGASGVMKLGAGTLTLSAENTFTGPLVISNGTIQVAQGKYLGSPSKVVIAKDGVLDVQETVNTYGVTGNDPIFPASTPVELAGKIVRNAGFARNYTFKNVRLTDDAEVEAAGTSVTGLGGSTDSGAGIYLQGHKLKIGGGNIQFGLNGPVDPNSGRVDDSTYGSVEQVSGTATLQGLSSIGGDTNNVWSLSGGATISFWDTRYDFPWALNVIGTGTLRSGYGTKNCWSGLVTVADGAKLTVSLYRNEAARLKVSGPVKVEGSGELAVDMTGEDGNAIVFADRVDASAASKVSVIARAGSTVTFSNDFVQATGSAFGKTYPGAVEFAGPTNVFGNPVQDVVGTMRFTGSDYVGIPGNLITKTKAEIEFQSAGYVEIDGSIYLRGANATPSHLVVTNTVLSMGTKPIFLPDEKGATAFADVYANSFLTNSLRIGGNQASPATTTKGAYRQWGGEIIFGDWTQCRLGFAQGNYGYFALNGGETKYVGDHPSFWVGMGGLGFCEIRGGVFRHNTVYLCSTNSYGQLRMTGGRMEASNIYFGNSANSAAAPGGIGVLALSGSNTIASLGDRIMQNMAVSSDYTIAVNDGARLESLRIARGSNNGGRIHVSVDGGVLTHNGTVSGDWYNGAQFRPESFLVQDGGVVFEPKMTGDATNNFAVMSSDLAAPEGYVVTAIALPTAEGFSSEKYMGPAQIRIYGEGTDAVACVDYDDVLMTPTNITVIAKGTGYAASGTTAQMASADGKTWYDCVVTVEPASATGRGLTKRGDQKLELTGENTYKGDTCVEGGTLKLSGEYSLPVGSGLFVDSGATVDLGGVKRSVPTLGGAGTVVGSVDVSEGIAAVCAETPLSVTGTLTFGEGATFAVENPEALDPDSLEKYVLVTAGTISGPLPMLIGLEGRWRLSRSGNSLCVGIPRGTVIFVR